MTEVYVNVKGKMKLFREAFNGLLTIVGRWGTSGLIYRSQFRKVIRILRNGTSIVRGRERYGQPGSR